MTGRACWAIMLVIWAIMVGGPIDADDWTCPYCGDRNNGHWLNCHTCGAHI